MRALAVLALSSAASAQGWEARVPERVTMTAGEPGTLEIAIAVDRGLVVSKDAPVIVDVTLPAGVTTRKPRLGRADAVDPEADAPRFAVPLKSATPGEHVAKIRLRMWLCGGRSCRPLDSKRTVVVVVSAGNSGQTPAP